VSEPRTVHPPITLHAAERSESKPASGHESKRNATRENAAPQRRTTWCMAFAARLIDLEPDANPDALDEVADSQFDELCPNGRAACDPREAAEAFAQTHLRRH